MKVWLDVLTPKQANFFAQLQKRLNGEGFKTVLTTREYREVNELLELRGVKSLTVGRHGGGSSKDKLAESAKRTYQLSKIIGDHEPEVAISFSSPEAARVAFGLHIPHYCVSDSPHAEAVCRLTVPLSRRLFTPWVIPAYAWRRYGIQPRDIIHYRALDPAVWLSCHKNDMSVADSMHLDLSKPVAVIRPPEEHAAYLSDRSAAISHTLNKIVTKLLTLDDSGVQVVIVPRYNNRYGRLRKQFGDRVIVPAHVVDGVSLLRAASVFIGGGGTMTAEAALLGIPSISYYPGQPTFVDKFLINHGLMERLLDPQRVALRAIAISRNKEIRESYRKKSTGLMQSMEDPLRVIISRIFKR